MTVRTWTPEISYLNEDNGEPLMRPASGGMWVSISDYHAIQAQIATAEQIAQAYDDAGDRAIATGIRIALARHKDETK